MTVTEYLRLITSAHNDKARFTATVEAGVAPYADMQDVLKSIVEAFDIDTAVGVQLDAIGIWIGRSRRVDTPLTGVYFTWNDTEMDGWNSGVWQGAYDPDSGLVELPDDAYRTLLRAKIAANCWDGTVDNAYAIWDAAFNHQSYLLIQDGQDMTMTVGVAGKRLTAVEQALLIGNYIPLKPSGVAVKYYSIVAADGKLFAWNRDNQALGGWGTGQWSKNLTPA